MTTEFDKSVLKTDQNVLRTTSLFYECAFPTPEHAVFTTHSEDRVVDGKLYISLKKRYLEEADPTEYRFAVKWLDSWEHWERFVDNKKFFRENIAIWRKELEMKMRSMAVDNMAKMAMSGKSFQAAKWLAERGWVIDKDETEKKEKDSEIGKTVKKEKDKYSADVVRLRD